RPRRHRPDEGVPRARDGRSHGVALVHAARAAIRSHSRRRTLPRTGRALRIEREGDSMNLVVGQSGFLGGIIARHLAQTNTPLRLLVRDGGTNIRSANVVRGDLKDRASLDAACAGVRTVITTANS